MSSYWGKLPDKIVRGYTGKVNKPNMRSLTDSATGKSYKVPDDDYRQYYGQGPETKSVSDPASSQLKPPQSIENYINAAFDGSSGFETQDVRATGGDTGHILKVEYSVFYKLLRITFRTNNSVVVYMNVPTAVAGELLHLAASNNTQVSANDGKLRHTLGIRFWDLVRIRGTVHGTRYPFKYVEVSDYQRGTAMPDWSKTEFVLVRKGESGKVPVAVNELSDVEKRRLDDRIAMVQEDPEPSPYSVNDMYRLVNHAKITDSARKSFLSEMDAINKGSGSESDKSQTIYNYLYIHGLL